MRFPFLLPEVPMPEPERHTVEALVCYANGRWETQHLAVDLALVERALDGDEAALRRALADRFDEASESEGDVAYVGVYHIPPLAAE